MDYTNKDGEFYKILDKETIYGRLTGDNLLSSIHEVVFITKEQYTAATGIEVVEIEEPKFPGNLEVLPNENQPEAIQE
ncbi:hypothetical protein HZP35_17590 [Elizabethkingia anophelis]|nr:hypothetical protein [Elizabethkingia anophelis]MCT4156752.1 hypothetical protein [Elizabethkingia anophelis]MCT4171073.1 hypothetical protein [Elizabethkingia anophelis]MCT4245488.1 hypothetical protein [Elizabethkingia anophelis]MCT4249221.1 hypothetical protein [Elizabethkingia anophelis]